MIKIGIQIKGAQVHVKSVKIWKHLYHFRCKHPTKPKTTINRWLTFHKFLSYCCQNKDFLHTMSFVGLIKIQKASKKHLKTCKTLHEPAFDIIVVN